MKPSILFIFNPGRVERINQKQEFAKDFFYGYFNFKKSGFKIVYCNYADSIGFFASIIIKFLGYDTNKGIGSVKSLIFYNKIVGLSFFLDNLVFKKFLGKNIVLLAKKQ